jgi:4a-hydroxytetrahydrobiopterin dehydratase
MGDSKHKLSVAEVEAAGLDGWRLVLNLLRARFRTGDFATGLALVDRIGAAAEEADHHPDVTLTYPEVRVTLSSHDVGGITSRDVDLARRISAFAAEAGAEPLPRDQTAVELALDTADGGRLGGFYAALFGADLTDWGPFDSSGQTTPLWFQTPDDGDAEHALPEADPPQRWHLDVWVPADEAEARVQAVVDAGGRLVSDRAAPSYWVLEDADGNRSCICSHAGR